MKLKPSRDKLSESLLIRLTIKEKNIIKRRANLYKTSVSNFMRYMALELTPRKKDLEK